MQHQRSSLHPAHVLLPRATNNAPAGQTRLRLRNRRRNYRSLRLPAAAARQRGQQRECKALCSSWRQSAAPGRSQRDCGRTRQRRGDAGRLGLMRAFRKATDLD